MPTAAKPRQLSLLPAPRRQHGGSVRQGRRKEARPLDPKRPVHLVLRSTRARGAWSFLNPQHRFHLQLIQSEAEARFGVKVYRSANVGNHLHLLVKAPSRRAFQSFLRFFSGRIVMLVTGARKGQAVGKFWDELAFSRILGWGREFERVKSYLTKNILEGLGALDRNGADRHVEVEALSDAMARKQSARPGGKCRRAR